MFREYRCELPVGGVDANWHVARVQVRVDREAGLRGTTCDEFDVGPVGGEGGFPRIDRDEREQSQTSGSRPSQTVEVRHLTIW